MIPAGQAYTFQFGGTVDQCPAVPPTSLTFDGNIVNPITPTTPDLAGDVICDGALTMDDSQYIVDFLVGSRTDEATCPLSGSGIYTAACDVDGNGTCDANDALLIGQCASGGNNALCPTMNRSRSKSAPSMPEGTIRFGTPSTSEMGVSVPVILDLAAGDTLHTATFYVDFDPSAGVVIGCVASDQFDVGACNEAFADGRVSFTLMDIEGVSGTVELGHVVLADIDAMPLSVDVETATDGSGDITVETEPTIIGTENTVPTAITLRQQMSLTTDTMPMWRAFVLLLIISAAPFRLRFN